MGKFKEAEGQRVITICNATLVWRNQSEPPNTSFVYVSDGSKEHWTQAGLDRLASFLIRRAFLFNHEGKEAEMNYVAPRGTDLICLDGYFGRAPIPAEVYQYSNFNPGQIEELETHLAELKNRG